MDGLAEVVKFSDAVVLGPGIGRSLGTKEAVPAIVEMIARHQKPILIDADAIRAVSESKRLLHDAVLTPHAGEFRAISGFDVPPGLGERVRLCENFAKQYSCIVLLKGHNTIVSDGHRVKVNRTGNPGMAVGGTGDVLSGIIGAFLAQGADAFSSAVAGAYIHGLSGDMVRKHKGFHMVASDLIKALPSVLRGYDHKKRR
jgi:NAD(P)H-hydrate epimerase